jgi:3-hydroxyacyl-CoA dehydrogenase, C-terminal domain
MKEVTHTVTYTYTFTFTYSHEHTHRLPPVITPPTPKHTHPPLFALPLSFSFTGLDTAFNIVTGWQKEFPSEASFVIPLCLEEKVKKGDFGRKTGKGFYHWDGDKVKGVV